MEANEVHTGKISYYNTDRGYGFLIDLVTNSEIFFHVSEVQGTIQKGNKVQFNLGSNQKGVLARNIILCKE